MCLIYILIFQQNTKHTYPYQKGILLKETSTPVRNHASERIFYVNTWFYLQVYKKKQNSKKHSFVSGSLKNLKLFHDVDSFMGVVFHGWIVSTITETNYIFRMQLRVFFLYSVCNILFHSIHDIVLVELSNWLCVGGILCKITIKNTRIFNNCLLWHLILSHIIKIQKGSICCNHRKIDLHHRHMPFWLSNWLNGYVWTTTQAVKCQGTCIIREKK